MKHLSLSLVVLLLAASSSALADDWGLILGQPDASAARGADIVYSGTITNTTGADLLLTGFELDPSPFDVHDDFEIDYTDEFVAAVFAPGFIVPSGGYTGSLFRVRFLTAATEGEQLFGALTLNASASPNAVTATFSATLQTVPEPAPVALLGLALLSARRRQARRA